MPKAYFKELDKAIAEDRKKHEKKPLKKKDDDDDRTDGTKQEPETKDIKSINH